MAERKHPCEGCIFWVYGPGPDGKICDYIGITGHARIKICPPGALCTVKTTDPEIRVGYLVGSENQRGAVSEGYTGRHRSRKLNEQEARILYDMGMSDGKIAEKLGVIAGTIRKWRCREGLEANASRLRKVRKEAEAQC